MEHLSLRGWKKVVSVLSDEALVEQTRAHVGKEREQTAWLVAHLAEIHRRDLGLKRGRCDTATYARTEFGLTGHQAWDRVSAARLALELPETIEKIASGELKLDQVQALLRTIAEVEKPTKAPVAKSNPVMPTLAMDLAPARTTEPVPIKPTVHEKRELLGQVLGKTRKESETALQTWKYERTGVRPVAKPRPHSTRKACVGSEWSELGLFQNDAELIEFDRLRDLLSHKLGTRDPHAVFAWMREFCLEKVDPVRQEARIEKRKQAAQEKQVRQFEKKSEVTAEQTDAAQATETTSDSSQLQFVAASQQQKSEREVIPAAKRRRTFIRFHGKCQHTDPKTGHKCESTAFVDVDHILEVCRGGTNDERNLTLSCASHNRRRYFWPAADQPTYTLGL